EKPICRAAPTVNLVTLPCPISIFGNRYGEKPNCRAAPTVNPTILLCSISISGGRAAQSILRRCIIPGI
ncbi:Hypothetical predicted protein, partial [Olea europaea subsp. europaea]